ncbi:MAG: hypothetical protein LUE86_05795 [Clostridiales bacterium]|nr:hypothetical protein [Clostridiales bacterium]
MAQIEIVQTMKLHLHTDKAAAALFLEAARTYAAACNVVSQYVFDHEFTTGITVLHKELYRQIREQFGLKSQMAQSTFRTVAARYKTVETQLEAKPRRY